MKMNIMQFGAVCLMSLAVWQVNAGDILVNNALVQGTLQISNTSGNSVSLNVNANNALSSSGGLQLNNGSANVSLGASTAGLTLSSGLATSPSSTMSSGGLRLDLLNPWYSGPVDFYQSNAASWRISSGNGTQYGSSNRLYFSKLDPATGGVSANIFIINPGGDISLYTTNNGGTLGCGFGCSTDGYFALGPGLKFATDSSIQLHAAQGVSVGTGAYPILSGNASGIISLKTIAAGQNLSITDSNGTLTFNVLTNSNPQTAAYTTNNIPAASSSFSFTHSFAAAPQTFALYAVCLTANNGYSAGDIVKADSMFTYNGANWMRPYFNVTSSGTTLVISTDNQANLYQMPKTGGAYVNIYANRAYWSLKLVATYTPGI